MISNRLKEIRESIGMSQDELSKKSGISRTMISQLETNQKLDCKISTLISISDALGYQVGDIFLSQKFTPVNNNTEAPS